MMEAEAKAEWTSYRKEEPKTREYVVVGEWNSRGVKKGKRTRYYEDGVTIERIEEGDFAYTRKTKKNNNTISQLHGRGRRELFDDDGTLMTRSEGTFKDGVLNGKECIRFWKNRFETATQKGEFKNGKFIKGSETMRKANDQSEKVIKVENLKIIQNDNEDEKWTKL